MLSLQDIIGDAARLLWGIILGKPMNFSWIIRNALAGSSRPMTKREIKWLYKQGIRVIITLTENPLPTEILDNLDLEVYHFPIKNHTVPSLQTLEEITNKIHYFILHRKPVLVHCAAGQGRTGTVLASYLIRFKGVQPEKAIKLIRELRPGSIEKHQEVALLTWNLGSKN